MLERKMRQRWQQYKQQKQQQHHHPSAKSANGNTATQRHSENHFQFE